MGQAHLPPDLYQDIIGGMKPGQSGYAVPWAMHVDESGVLWLKKKFSIHENPGGTVCMLVTRQDDGYVVELGRSSYRWQPAPGNADKGDSVPVVKLLKGKGTPPKETKGI